MAEAGAGTKPEVLTGPRGDVLHVSSLVCGEPALRLGTCSGGFEGVFSAGEWQQLCGPYAGPAGPGGVSKYK